MIDEHVFTFAGRGSGRHGAPVSRGLLGLLGSSWPGSLLLLLLLLRRYVFLEGRLLGECVADGLPLGPGAQAARGLLLLESLLHLLDPGLEGL